MDFYAEKSRDLPRFTYRNLFKWLRSNFKPEARAAHIEQFCKDMADLKPEGDWQKMKWCLPKHSTACNLTNEEIHKIEAVFEQKGKRRNEMLLEVYPHCSDEFSTQIGFLDAAFGQQRYELIDKQTPIFTLGSCFARNIARHLVDKGFSVSPFVQAEDLNSPFSNAKMLSLCAAQESVRRDYIRHWVEVLYPPNPAGLEGEVVAEMQRMDELIRMLKSSRFLIVTCGNVIDYFLPPQTAAYEVGPSVAPKFLAVSYSEDITVRKQLTGKLKKAGAEFRLGTYPEVMEAMQALYNAIRTINPTAHLLFTLSPIPIDSAIGISHAGKIGAVEIDCISKSLLRVSLNELMLTHADDKALYYFPSFEIVRWIAPNMDAAVFGKEDAASRHVSQKVLSGVYDYFVHKFAIAQSDVKAA